MGIRILFMINKRFYTTLLLLLLYNYYYYTLTMIRSQAGPLWVRHFGRHLGPLWGSLGMVRRGPYSFTPQNRMIHPPPSPYHWARPVSAGSAKPGEGGGIKGLFATWNSLT